jgi:HEAT repeat protein
MALATILPGTAKRHDRTVVGADEALGRAEVTKMLQVKSKDELIANIGAIGGRGEFSAQMGGYAGDVCSLLSHPEPEVVAAACEALAGMGDEGLMYADTIAAKLAASNAMLRAAAAGALGYFGDGALKYETSLVHCMKDPEDNVKSAAICALGMIGAEGEAASIAECLGTKSPVVVAAACQALGMLSSGEGHIATIATKLDESEVRYAAISAILNFGASAGTPYVDKIISVCLTDKDSATRQTAASTLGGIADKGSVSKIKELLKSDTVGVRCSAALTLGYMGDAAKDLTDSLVELLDDKEEDESELYLSLGGGNMRAPPASRRPKCAAIAALGMIGAESAAGKIADELGDESWEVRMCALDALASMGDAGRSASSKIATCLEDDIFVVRAKACECLGSLKAEDQMSGLVDLFDDKAPSVKVAALNALAEAPEVAMSYSNEVFKCMNDVQSQAVRAAAISCLGSMGETGNSYASIIATMLYDQDAGVRAAAVEALGKLGDYGAAYAEEVAYCLQDDDQDVRYYAAVSLGNMGAEGQAFVGEIQMLCDDPYTAEAAQEAYEKLSSA